MLGCFYHISVDSLSLESTTAVLNPRAYTPAVIELIVYIVFSSLQLFLLFASYYYHYYHVIFGSVGWYRCVRI